MVNKFTSAPKNEDIISKINEIIDEGYTSEIYMAVQGTTTFSQISTAYNSGMTILLKDENNDIGYLLRLISGAEADFIVGSNTLITVDDINNWTWISNYLNIPDAQVNSDWNANSGVAQILNKPTIPTVPTNVSAFTNDAGYITLSDVPTEIFIATYGTTTYSEIEAAYNTGKIVFCKRHTSISNLIEYTSNGFAFIATAKATGIFRCNYYYCNNNDVWSNSYYDAQLTSNQVTSLSSSSTNTQYPSAKCVYDELADKADTDLSNVPTTKGILTESYVNGTSGYRIYADNYCVQWGRFHGKSGTITLLKSYANTDYCVAYSSSARISWYCSPSTNKLMSVASDSNSSYDCYWITTGFIGGQ